MRLTLVANSRKTGARCLAGFTDDGRLIRPVSSAAGGAIDTKWTRFDGQSLRPLDIIEFDEYEAVPLPYQSENMLINVRSIRLSGRASEDDVREAMDRQTIHWPMDVSDKKIPARDYSPEERAQSLMLLPVEEFRVAHHSVDPDKKWRAIFAEPGMDSFAELPLTDDNHYQSRGVYSQGHSAIVCISVGELYDWDECHYKLVAGVIPIGL